MHQHFARRVRPAVLFVFLMVMPIWGASFVRATPADPAFIPVRLHPENPRIFQFRGKPTLLIGASEHYGAVLNPDFDFTVYLDTLARAGLNYTRIFTGTYVQTPGTGDIEKNTLAPKAGRFIAPWARSDQAGYHNGGNKFDLKRWDAAYFRRLHGFVAAARQRGIVVELTLFSSFYDEKGWAASPLNARNNVNGVGKLQDYKQAHTLENGPLLDIQEKLVRKFVEELRRYDNVIFEIQNEPWADRPVKEGFAPSPADAVSLAWQRRMAAVIAAAESTMPVRHAIAENVANRSQHIPKPDHGVSIFNFHRAYPPVVLAENAQTLRALGYDATGADGADDRTYRRHGWHFILAGGALYNILDYSFTTDRPDGTDTQKASGGGSPALRSQLGVLSRFMHDFGDALWTMRPDVESIRTGAPETFRMLADAGRAYALYLEGGPQHRPVLDLPFGAYDLKWVNPRDGRVLAEQRIVHSGGPRALVSPRYEEDLAISIVRSRDPVAVDDLPAKSTLQVSSPDGRLRVSVLLTDMAGSGIYPRGRRLYYQVDRIAPDRKSGTAQTILSWSPLGLTRADADFVDGLALLNSRVRTVTDRYQMVTGKQLSVTHTGRELTVNLRGDLQAASGGERLAVDVRAYNDGIAFRYRFPDKRPGYFEVISEATGFRLPETTRAFISEHDDPHQWTPAYENYYRYDMPVGTASSTRAGWSFPALFRQGETWALLSETGVDRGYFGARLDGTVENGVYRIRMPDTLEADGDGAVTPRWTMPWTMPWRILIVGQGLAPIVESNLVTTLAEPSRIKNPTWVKPGRASWSWWSSSDSPRDYEALVKFVDLAADMGWEYSLVDANWDLMKGGDWRQLAQYAASKKVKLWLWYNSGGRHNTVTERPRDRMVDRKVRQAEMQQIAAAGIAGIKVDFFHSDKQNRIQQYLDILEDAAAAKLLINFHGCTLPRGWSRTYPNLLAMESVRGGEQYKFDDAFPVKAPAHNTNLVFTRNVIGPMDYTPVTFSDVKYPHRTTYAHELALSVVFEVGVLHLADAVEAYQGLPAEPKAFLKSVPVVWDDTRLLAGTPTELAVVARRRGRGWWVGGINGQAQAKTIPVSLAFLDGGKGKSPARYNINIISDGGADRSFTARNETGTAADTIEVAMRGNGGFVMQITRVP